MKRLDIVLGKERQCHITKQLVHSFSVNIRISQPSKVMYITILGLINPDVDPKRMHQLYIVYLFASFACILMCDLIMCLYSLTALSVYKTISTCIYVRADNNY